MDSPLSDYLSEHHAFCRLLHDFCDRTRQFSRSEDSVQVRKELLQECLRCANLVSMEYPILEKAVARRSICTSVRETEPPQEMSMLNYDYEVGRNL